MKIDITSNRLVAFAWIAVLPLVVIAHAELREKEKGRDVASIQYLRVYQLAYFPDNADFTNQGVEFHIESNLAHVGTESISLFIDGKGARIPITSDADGWFTLPFSKEMLVENPEIVSNQPKGSLSLECVVSQKSIALPACRAITYRGLVEPELLSTTIEAIVDDKRACPFPEMLSLRLDKPETGNVLIHTVGTTKGIPISIVGGFFQIPLSSGLMAENPLVVFPETSKCVYYVEDCGMPRPKFSGRVSRF